MERKFYRKIANLFNLFNAFFSQKIECPSHNCTINTSQCQICQEKFCEEIAGDEIKIFELNQKSMADLRLRLTGNY